MPANQIAIAWLVARLPRHVGRCFAAPSVKANELQVPAVKESIPCLTLNPPSQKWKERGDVALVPAIAFLTLSLWLPRWVLAFEAQTSTLSVFVDMETQPIETLLRHLLRLFYPMLDHDPSHTPRTDNRQNCKRALYACMTTWLEG